MENFEKRGHKEEQQCRVNEKIKSKEDEFFSCMLMVEQCWSLLQILVLMSNTSQLAVHDREDSGFSLSRCFSLSNNSGKYSSIKVSVSIIRKD